MMASNIRLKNLEDAEFKLSHEDGDGAINITSTELADGLARAITNESDIATIESDVAAIDARVTVNEADIVATNERVTVASDKITPLFASQPRFNAITDYRATMIDSELFTYKAFPFFFVGNNKLNAIGWSSGEGHGNSDEVRYAIVDNDTHEFTSGVFFDMVGVEYFTDWLDPYLDEGEYVNFRSVYTVIKESGVLNVYTTSSIDIGDIYSLWGTPYQYNGDWYTGSYRTVGGYPRAALVKSTDNMKTWSFFSLVASNSAREYTEAAFLNTGGTNIISVIREDLTGLRDLVFTSSADGGSTWTPAVGTLLTPISATVKGTQPFLLKLNNGNVMLLAGKRTGSSGLNAAGTALEFEDITGIAYWISDDDGATWSAPVQIAPSWSTDCGNPSAKLLSNGNVAVAFYVATGATNGAIGVEPSIFYTEINPTDTKTV